MKKAILSIGLLSLVMVLTSLTTTATVDNNTNNFDENIITVKMKVRESPENAEQRQGNRRNDE